MENTEKKEVTTGSKSNKEIAEKLAKNPSWILTHLLLSELDNVIETGKKMLIEKANKEIAERKKEDEKAQKILSKHNL
jgi:uncharacterized membrane protein